MRFPGCTRLFALLCLSLAALPAIAQSGRFSGQITDPQGAAVPGAVIQIINEETLVKRETESDPSGSYSVAYLPAGKYQIIVTAPNFNTSDAKDVALGVSDAVVYNVQLTIGSTATEVTVSGGGASSINMDSPEVSGTITSSEVQSLALNGRNFTQLITLTPGVSNQSQQDEALVGPVGNAKYSFNGGRVEYNSFEIDGSDVLNLSIYPTSAPLIVTPSLDAIQEIKVLTSNYGAMYGRTASGVVTAITKSGTSSFHGNAYEYVRNELFNARNYFDPAGVHAPLYRRNDFGFTLGGPIYIPHLYNTNKSKVFFFYSEEFRSDETPVSYRVGAPDARVLKGDFAEFCPPPGTTITKAISALYPHCPENTANPGIGPEEISPEWQELNIDANMLAILNSGIVPIANATTGCNSSVGQCYVASVSPKTSWREELFRVDQDITSRNRLTLRYVHDAWNTTVLSPQWGYLGSQNSYPTIRNTFVGPGINALVGISSTITQSILNNLNFSYTDSQITLKDVGGPGVNLNRPAILNASTCGAPTATVGFTCPLGYIYDNGFGGKIPGISVTGVSSELGGGDLLLDTGYMPWEHTSPTYNLNDNATKLLGKHTIQAGTQLIELQRNQTNSAVGADSGDVQGLLNFQNPGNSANTFFNLLQGNAKADGLASYQQDSAQARFHEFAFIAEPYAQDDWRVNQRLTVNLGFRLSLFGNFYERGRQVYNWEPSAFDRSITNTFRVDPYLGELVDNATGQPIPRNTSSLDPRIGNGLVRCGFRNIPASCETPHYWNPAPRAGFAWDVTGRGTSALRAGYGIFWEHGTPYEVNTGSLEGNPPAVTSVVEYSPPDGLACVGGGVAGNPANCPHGLAGAFPISVASIPTATKWAYAQQWNLSYEQQLKHDFVVTFGYVGSRGTHLTAERQLNELEPLPNQLNPYGIHQPFIPSTDCDQSRINTNNLAVVCGPYNNSVNSPAAVRVFAPGLDKIVSIEPIASSSYHSFQVLARRTKGPLTIDGAYTYSHSIDDSSDRTELPVNGLDIHANKASSSFDQRNLVEISYIYRLPLEQWLSQVLDWLPRNPAHDWKPDSTPATPGRIAHTILSNWDLSGLTLEQSGTPFSVYNSGGGVAPNGGPISAVDNAGVANGLTPLYGSYPDKVASARHALQSAKELGGDNAQSFGPLLLNPAAFVAPRGLTFGNAGRNSLNNPRRTNFDVSLLKHFTLPHESNLEFRAEAFNIFNHTQFRIYDPSMGNSGSNTVSCYGGYEQYYSAGGANASCLAGSAFLHPYDAHRARTMQFALKLAF